MALADGGQVMVSSLVRELMAGSDRRFFSRGERTLKGLLDWEEDIQSPIHTSAFEV